MIKVSVFWFRRDLRLEDNTALYNALLSDFPVLPIFIFDKNILDKLPETDPRVNFIYSSLISINNKITKKGSSVLCLIGDPYSVWEKLISEYEVNYVFYNKDYEPYANQRDLKLSGLFKENGIKVKSFKDQVIFEQDEIIKSDGTPYTIFTPFKNKWLSKFESDEIIINNSEKLSNYCKCNFKFPELSDIGFQPSSIKVREFNLSELENYSQNRNIPGLDSTSYLSPHLRFGSVSIRKIVNETKYNLPFLNELIWREFFMQILFHFPNVTDGNFKPQYNHIEWRNNEDDFTNWCQGTTGFPIVDAGMRELNKTGYMHNRVRMVTASFLCKHLLIDWRWGEAYFAEKLLDFELSSNNGNWQWAAGTGCDAAPYFRVFNPAEQQRKFDNDFLYIKKWIPEINTSKYRQPIVDHSFARQRAINAFKKSLEFTRNAT